MVVNKANTVKNLTKDQLIGIYTGTIKNWSEVGGSDNAIVVVGRESRLGEQEALSRRFSVLPTNVYTQMSLTAQALQWLRQNQPTVLLHMYRSTLLTTA